MAVHFVNFRDNDEYLSAIKVFDKPDGPVRAYDEIADPGDSKRNGVVPLLEVSTIRCFQNLYPSLTELLLLMIQLQ